MIDNKENKDIKELNDENLEEAAGGGCWFGARFVAPDGHDVGCDVSYYRVQFNDREFCEKFPKICPIDGGPHDTDGRHYCGNGVYKYKCSKCQHFVDKEGNYHSGWGVTVE